jgi:biopolymer transport protein ExbB/TolQ
MRKSTSSEFTFQIFTLIFSIIVVHSAYVALIRPNANALLQAQLERQAAGEITVVERSVYIVLKDYEQETCFILMLWAFSILGYKGMTAWRQHQLLERDLLQLPESLPIGPEDTRTLADLINALPSVEKHYLLPRALLTGIERFSATRNVQDVSTAVRNVCESEGERQESELSIIRYIAWAIPSVGFIGTVRGIGDALGQAHRAVEGDITGVTENLGVAFNSTFVALVISIILMFFVHQLQLYQERLVLDSERYVDHWLVRKLRS